MDSSQPELLRDSSVAQRVGLSTRQIRRAVSEGTFPSPVRVGKRGVAWRRSDIDAWIAALPTATSDKKEPNA